MKDDEAKPNALSEIRPNADRYSRQERFLPGGVEDSQRIRASRVAVVGLGALGSVVAEILARAGVGELRLIDRDVVEWSNLQRQALYNEEDARQAIPKSEAAANHLARINGDVELVPHVLDLQPHNLAIPLGRVDLIIDGSDNFAVRLLVNDWALSKGIPWVHGGCVGSSGQVRAFLPGERTCFRCLVPDVPPASAMETCDTAGVLGPATHLIASMQAAEAIKILSGHTEMVQREVTHIDLWTGKVLKVALKPNDAVPCPACDQGRYEFLNAITLERGEAICGRDAVQIQPSSSHSMDLAALERSLCGLGKIERKRFFARFNPSEFPNITLTIFNDGRVIVDGTQDVQHAIKARDRFLGA
ncbi:MAG: ThiF family adenylyltransferase [Planctomycetota bacterium]